jgi:DNA-binding CsgD family transcriptional regulator
MARRRTASSNTGSGFRLRYGQREIPVTATDIVIGRSSACHLTLTGALVSRRHARVTLQPDGLLIEDLGSRNGLRVNGAVVEEPTSLRHGDMIEIGLQTLEVLEESMLRRSENLSTLPPARDSQPTAITRLDLLSERELEIFELIVNGHTHRQIADQLHLSVKTVESHRTHLGEKLDCKTRNELVRYAILAGVLRIDHPSLR